MKRINIVYAYMREPRFEIALPDHDARAIWTVKEEPGADVVVYYSGYSYEAKQASRNPTAFRILYLYEPVTVYPGHFFRSFWKPFDCILTWSDTLVAQRGKFVRFPALYYDFPFGAVHGMTGPAVCPGNWRAKRRAICQVAGNKYSFVSSELYSRRREIARWFGRVGKLPCDTFGVPPMPVPGYKGPSTDKLATLSKYRYALCLENDAHPLWSAGYVTEKVFDCFYAFSLPIYLGAVNIEKYIPTDCFVDLRHFDSLEELEDYLLTMTDEEYVGYLTAIERFLQHYGAPRKHSCFRLYETAIEMMQRIFYPGPENKYFGFWQKASLKEGSRCALMMAALPVYKMLCGTRYAGTG